MNEKLTFNEIALKIFKPYPDMVDIFKLQITKIRKLA